ncbi:uncharacterized protein LOC143635316 [Bidens hawaiensis]|uniref:uncharacterized protein LOC143635316 n=1 Tax=Bidens hawaiensis TaxID=980011 RepID=UPI00404B8846
METNSRATNPLMVEELSYDTETMNNEFNNLFDSLTDKQLGVYNEIMSALIDKKRLKGEVVLNVASSGIASLLLDGGRTAHSRFLIPINLIEDSICPISLIIWDEASMIHKHAFEALDMTLNDVMNGDSGNTSEAVFGGKDHALLAPLNEVVQEINERMLALFPGEEVKYLSSDSLAECEDVSEDLINRMPNHRLVLKVGVPIMLLRNINHKKGLCNGTCLQFVSLGRRVIEAKVVSGTNIGYRTLISRVSLTLTDKKLPFKLKRRQFPISVCFAMTINKSQGQSLSRVEVYLKDPVFSHGQLYVALSRVNSRDGIKLVILDKESKLTNKTTNVVYNAIFGKT